MKQKHSKKFGILIGGVCLSMVFGIVNTSAQNVEDNNSSSLCDVDGDGTIDLLDANLILKHALKIIDVFPNENAKADADGDGSVTLTDANLTLKHALKIINRFPIEDSSETPEPTETVNPTEEPSTKPSETPSENPTPTTPEPMEPSVELYKQNQEYIEQQSLNLIADWIAGEYTDQEAEERANALAKDLCGVVFHTKRYSYEKTDEATQFFYQQQLHAESLGFDHWAFHMIGDEQDGWFLIYF